MSLEALFPDRPQPAKPVRLTIRRRLLGRGARLRTLGVAAGLLSLGLTYGLPAHASTKNWIGPNTLTDWYANSTFWSTTGFPQPSDDAVNSALTKPMTLGADTSVNSFFSNSAFTLNGGAFSGSQLNSASTIQVNNVFTLNGGTINNFTLNAGVQQTGGPAPSSVVVTSNLSTLSNTIVNANVDMTNPNAYLRLLNANTVNGAITMATTSHGLDIYSTNDSLTLSATGSLTGFGNVYQDGSGGFLINNGLVSANVSGKTLSLGQSNFATTGATQVTKGATLNVTSTSFTQTAGLTQVDGVLNLVNAPLALKGGVLDGSGTINGNVVNTGGTVSPGDSPGTLTIAGNYTQGSGGALDIEFTNSLHDLLNVTGLATTGGLLDVNFLDSAYTGGVGSQFAFLDYGTLVPGTGANFGFTVTGHNGFTYTVVNDSKNSMLDLQVLTVGAPAVPEASTTVSLGLLLALGLGGLAVAAKRRKSVRA